jgi:hypothetical protein
MINSAVPPLLNVQGHCHPAFRPCDACLKKKENFIDVNGLVKKCCLDNMVLPLEAITEFMKAFAAHLNNNQLLLHSL